MTLNSRKRGLEGKLWQREKRVYLMLNNTPVFHSQALIHRKYASELFVPRRVGSAAKAFFKRKRNATHGFMRSKLKHHQQDTFEEPVLENRVTKFCLFIVYSEQHTTVVSLFHGYTTYIYTSQIYSK